MNRPKKLYIYHSKYYNPYQNLATETFLLENLEPDEFIMYLWQNERTVVIGKNQNPYKECALETMEKEGVLLARRPSGGGAVFHDLGNLNFTFLASEKNFNIPNQLEIIINALKTLGVGVQKSGRNDIVLNGRKFSGNAFYKSGQNCLHHGTIMLNVNIEQVARYLQVSATKLAAKGVDSVPARVINLREVLPQITADHLKLALAQALEKQFGLQSQWYNTARLSRPRIDALEKMYSESGWVHGKNFAAMFEFQKRFEWGEIIVCLNSDHGIITSSQIFSDSLHPQIIEKVENILSGLPFSKIQISDALRQLQNEAGEGTEKEIIKDIALFFDEQKI